MICIADSGSTKTDWVVIDPTEKVERMEMSTIGFNPFYIKTEEIANALEAAFEPTLTAKVSAVYFYGAGCSSPGRKDIIARGIEHVFKNAIVEVEHDLLAAARATCQFASGVACILGTGSNSCYYDGGSITDNVPSLGFILGDEGSGASLGRRLLQAFIYRELPKELEHDLVETYAVDKEIILEHVYHKPFPNRYVASFALFCGKHAAHPFMAGIIRQVLEEFIVRHVKKYAVQPTDKVHFVGSVAWTFQNELKDILHRYQLSAGSFVRKPIDHLVEYHCKTS